ncbi:MAG TPA: polysaccharide deacetylase family protein, partial [Gaiellaceae bacterium]|nr:polysaccharide deacetylase family protein [Gaiellaceae bacterium]
MNRWALVLTYHAIERGPAPLCVDPRLFREHLDCLAEAGARMFTVSQLAAALRAGDLPERAVALTFDDGFASVADEAAPLLAERGLTATVFCVAGYVGRMNDWPSQPAGRPQRPLASVEQLAGLAEAGFEIGSHGLEHAPLDGAAEQVLRREIVESRAVLESMLGVRVSSFAYPYGALPEVPGRLLVAEEYTSACTTTIGRTQPGCHLQALPRVDVHYLRRPELLRRAVAGALDSYLSVRRVAARGR